jgi:nanoRNase/pAp phosphatase (c-di-AMP/oligoRNAs hydrolase)
MRKIPFAELCDLLAEYRDKKVLLTFHSIGDRDGVGSAAALSAFFTNSTIATPDFVTNNAKKMLEYVGRNGRLETRFREDSDLAVILDANTPAVLGEFKERLGKFTGEVLIIDHHAPHDDFGGSVVSFNDETYNSTASIVYDALQSLGAEVSKDSAFLLLNGIIADSADLRNSSPKTFRQIADLLEIAKIDYSFISEYFHSNVPVSNRYETTEDILASKAEVVGDYVIMYGRARARANVAADAALNLGADAAVFWVTTEREASLSARLLSPLDKKLGIHLGLVMEGIAKMVGGTGGGHACAAGAYGPKRESAQDAGEEVVRKIKEKMEIR